MPTLIAYHLLAMWTCAADGVESADLVSDGGGQGATELAELRARAEAARATASGGWAPLVIHIPLMCTGHHRIFPRLYKEHVHSRLAFAISSRD